MEAEERLFQLSKREGSMKNFELFESQSKILKKIATGYPANSPERAAIRRATLALCFVTMEHLGAFESFQSDSQRELSPAKRQKLKEMGLE